MPEAVAAYDDAIGVNPSAYPAEQAMIGKARAYRAMGNVAEARRCIGRIRARFPDSSSFAEAALLDARIDGRATASLEASLTRETEATALYKDAMQTDRNKDEAAAVRLLETVIDRYPDTPAALRCRDARAHILLRHRRPEEMALAGQEFLYILATVADSAPNSRIAETARMRLAAMHHSFKNRQDAIAVYEGLLNAEDKAIASRAALQLAGLQFELLQRELRSVGHVVASRWDDLRAFCSSVAQSKDAKRIEQARAEVMIVESLAWQERYAEVVAAADAFVTKYQGDELKQDVATVRFFAGEAAQSVRQYDKALGHFRWIVDAYRSQREMWPGMDHMPRTYFRIWETLRRMRAPPEEVAAAAQAIFDTFPESDYAEHVRIVTRQEAERAKLKLKAQSQPAATGG